MPNGTKCQPPGTANRRSATVSNFLDAVRLSVQLTKGADMKTFMAVYTGDPANFEKYQKQFPDPEKRKANERAGMDAWKKWGEAHRKSIVADGGPLSKTKRVTRNGVADLRNNLAAYTVVRAESQDAAAKMFLDHPHFTIFPGDGVEIMEVLPIPQRD